MNWHDNQTSMEAEHRRWSERPQDVMRNTKWLEPMFVGVIGGAADGVGSESPRYVTFSALWAPG